MLALELFHFEDAFHFGATKVNLFARRNYEADIAQRDCDPARMTF
jgi:hypothetical protein